MHNIAFNQTWEDFEVDKKILELRSTDTLICVTSAGCNVLNASLQEPKKIYSIDANPDQNHLLHLKIAATKLSYEDFWKLFGEGHHPNITTLYTTHLREKLPENSQLFWDENIHIFTKNLFDIGKLGSLKYLRSYIRLLCGVSNIETFYSCTDLNDQAQFYASTIEPKLWNWKTKYIPTFTMALYGAHLRQIWNCYKKGLWSLKHLYKKSQKHIFTTIPNSKNFFWRFICLGKYSSPTSCSEYLTLQNYSHLAQSADKIEIYDADMEQFLNTLNESSVDKFSLSDIIEFASQSKQKRLWQAVLRVAKPGAIISYRSFAPGIFPPETMKGHFIYEQQISEELTRVERTISYLGVYKLTVKK